MDFVMLSDFGDQFVMIKVLIVGQLVEVWIDFQQMLVDDGVGECDSEYWFDVCGGFGDQ